MPRITLEIDGKRYVAVPEDVYDKLGVTDDAELLPMPPVDPRIGGMPAKAAMVASLANQIILWRRAAGLNQEELAKLAGVTRETVYRTERGQTKGKSILKLAKALDGVLPEADFRAGKTIVSK